MEKKDFFVSLRRDMPHILWSGINLRPEVDIQFRLLPFTTECRQIKLQLIDQAGRIAAFVTGSAFCMSDLGNDHRRLESTDAELTVIARHMERMTANMEPDGGVLIRIHIAGEDQQFRLYPNEPGQLPIDRWDWFIDPLHAVGNQRPIHEWHPVGIVQEERLAA